jgi:hypothetical protein
LKFKLESKIENRRKRKRIETRKIEGGAYLAATHLAGLISGPGHIPFWYVTDGRGPRVRREASSSSSSAYLTQRR